MHLPCLPRVLEQLHVLIKGLIHVACLAQELAPSLQPNLVIEPGLYDYHVVGVVKLEMVAAVAWSEHGHQDVEIVAAPAAVKDGVQIAVGSIACMHGA